MRKVGHGRYKCARCGAALDREILKELFDFDDLHEWWTMSGIPRVGVPSLDHAQARTMTLISRGKPAVRVILLDGKEIHRCQLAADQHGSLG